MEKITYIKHEFEVSTLGDLAETNVPGTVQNLENAIAAHIRAEFPMAEVEIEGTYGTFGASNRPVIEPYDAGAEHRVQEIAQKVWDQQLFEWVDDQTTQI